jgi:hypothetical protein
LHFSFKPEHLVIGFARESVRPGQPVPVITKEFLVSEDGERLVTRLNEVSKLVLARASPTAPVHESQVDHLIAVFRRDRSVDVWINEVAFMGKVRAKQSFKVGDEVYSDQIADIAEMVPQGISFPDDCGYLIIFSVGWRKALLYDFTTLNPEAPAIPRNVPRMLGAAWAYLMYRSRFAVTEDEWKRILAEKWFPFVGLPSGLIDEMIAHARAAWPIDGLLPKIIEAVKKDVERLRAFVESGNVFARHRGIVLPALSAYERGDHPLVVSALFPRIEGILREYHALAGSGSPKPATLAGDAARSGDRHEFSLLLPLKFEEYLKTVFFASEDFSDPTKVVHVTRHAVAHGVAEDKLLDEKAATLGVLILQQIGYLLSDAKRIPEKQPNV